MPVTLSRNPEDRWVGNRTFSVRGTDGQAPLTVIIDEDEMDAIVDTMNIEGPDPEDIEGALQQLERLASKETAVTTGEGRVIDLRPKFD